MIKKTNVDDRELERIHALMGEVVRKSSRRQGSCLYRGEPECYPIVSSGLYRQCPDCEEEVFARISNLIQTSRPSGGLERLYS